MTDPIDFARRSAARRGVGHFLQRGCVARRPLPLDPASTRLCGAWLHPGEAYCTDCQQRLQLQPPADPHNLPKAIA